MAEESIGLTKEQKTGFVLLLIFAILGLTLGFLQIRNTMLAPFALNNDVPVSLRDEINDVDALRYRDTDNDGLTDYNELYMNGTSPYLFDTYGYGFSDKEVIERGLALCANAGKNCANEETPMVSSTLPSGDNITQEAISAIDDYDKLLNDPAEIRKMLIKSGMEKDLLDKISDAEILSLVNQLMTSSTLENSSQ